MTSQELIAKYKTRTPIGGQNIMGTSEDMYDPIYQLYECFGEEELLKMSEREIDLLLKLGNFLSEMFY